MKRSLFKNFFSLMLAVVCLLSAFYMGGCKSELERAREQMNPSNYGFVTVDRYSTIVSNRYEQVDVRKYGIPRGSTLISYDGEYLYFMLASSTNYINIYSYHPVQKQSEQLFSLALIQFQFMFGDDTYSQPKYIKEAYVTRDRGFIFIGTGYEYESDFYKATFDSQGNLVGTKKFTASWYRDVINEVETADCDYKFKFADGRTFSGLALVNGNQEKFVFKNCQDKVWNLIKEDAKIDYLTCMGPYGKSKGIVEVAVKKGGLVTASKDYYYFLCSYEKGSAEFFAYSDGSPYGKIFLVD